MKMLRILLVTALLIAAPLAAVAEDAARKRAQRPFAAIDLVKMFTAGPLSDPQPPSTLLPAGATSVELNIRAATPTLCRYSVGKNLPIEQMTPFDTRQSSPSPKTLVRGLDPNPSKVNDVYVRCAAAPDAVLHLQYRSLPAAKPGFPRTANLWGSHHFTGKGMEHASRVDLWLGAGFNAEQIRQLRRLNPNCFILTSINTVENNDVPDEYFLRDTTGRKIEVWPGTFRFNLTRPEVAEYQARYAYQRMLKSGLMVDGCFFDNFMMSQRWLTHDIYDRPVQLDADGSGMASDKDQFDKAWRAEGCDFLKLCDGLPADRTGIYTSGPYKGLQAHTNFVLERSWVHSRLGADIPAPPYKKQKFVQYMKPGIAHGIVPSVHMEIYQDIGVGEASLQFMKAVSQEIKG